MTQKDRKPNQSSPQREQQQRERRQREQQQRQNQQPRQNPARPEQKPLPDDIEGGSHPHGDEDGGRA